MIIPARNEADRIAATVRAARALPGVAGVIVVDDGSTDATGSEAGASGATVLRHPRNRGKAAALETGADAIGANATGADATGVDATGVDAAPENGLLLFLDADLGDTAGEAARLIEPVRRGAADMTIAQFPHVPGRGGGRGLVLRLARWGVRRFTGQAVHAPLSGQRCLTRAAFAAARPLAAGFGVEVALTIAVLRAGFRVLEVPTQMDHRVTGNDAAGKRHRARQLRDVARALLREIVRR
ncbi:MAG: glycosyltransferase [Acetobacteraceae bacterium]|nr:glycosyltransferase [Acetobacteraceae bacterium]